MYWFPEPLKKKLPGVDRKWSVKELESRISMALCVNHNWRHISLLPIEIHSNQAETSGISSNLIRHFQYLCMYKLGNRSSRARILPHSWLSIWSLHTVVNNACHHKTNDNRWFPALTNTVCRFDIREDKFQTHRFGRDMNRQLGTNFINTRKKRCLRGSSENICFITASKKHSTFHSLFVFALLFALWSHFVWLLWEFKDQKATFFSFGLRFSHNVCFLEQPVVP